MTDGIPAVPPEEAHAIHGRTLDGRTFLVLLRGGRRPTAKECVAITYIGASQLCAYCAWVAAGLPLGA